MRLDARQVINLAILLLSLLVVVLIARTGWRSLQEYRQARQVVRGMERDSVCKAMVKAFHALGQAMDIPTIAECVENVTVRRQLERLGVDYLQGFEIAPPQPLSQYLQASAS